jgi:hypothetical protein
LLPYTDKSATTPVQESTVQSTTVDEYLKTNQLTTQLGLLKIDTQGNDLRVLQGATETLKQTQPWIILELIYAPLYKGQAQPHEIAAFLAELDFAMVAHFNEYYSTDGWLGWADACFVPNHLLQAASGEFHGRPTAEDAARSKGTWGRIQRQIRRTFRHGSR